MRHSPIQRRTPLARASRGNSAPSQAKPATKTKRLKEYEAEFREASKLVKARSQGRCEFVKIAGCLFRGCTEQAVHVHHRKLRSQGGGDEIENLVHLCVPCHGYLHNHPEKARELGLILRRNDPVKWPESSAKLT